MKKEIEKKIQIVQNLVTEINKTGKIPTKTSSLFLKPPEECYLEEFSSLYEIRSRRISSGGAIRVMKGVYIGGHSGKSYPELTKIDSGKLILTNERFIFDGSVENRSINLDKVLSVETLRDSIEVSIENRQKSQIFTVENPHLWSMLVQIVKRKQPGQQISIDISYK